MTFVTGSTPEVRTTCSPPRITQPEVVIDGRPGRIRHSCDDVEASVVVERRAYLFTLFRGDQSGGDIQASDARAAFDEFAATIRLRPEDAEESPPPGASG